MLILFWLKWVSGQHWFKMFEFYSFIKKLQFPNLNLASGLFLHFKFLLLQKYNLRHQIPHFRFNAQQYQISKRHGRVRPNLHLLAPHQPSNHVWKLNITSLAGVGWRISFTTNFSQTHIVQMVVCQRSATEVRNAVFRLMNCTTVNAVGIFARSCRGVWGYHH